MKRKPMTAAELAALTKAIADGEQKIAALERELAALERKRPPRPRSEWPGLAAEHLVLGTAHAPELGSLDARVRAAVDRGWIARCPSLELRDALLAIEHEDLWNALHLDAHADSLSARVRRDLKAEAKTEREMDERLRAFRASVSDLVSITAKRTRVSAENLDYLTSSVETINDALAAAAYWAHLGCSMMRSHLDDIEQKSKPHRASRWRGRQLAWLLGTLAARPAKGRPWTHRRLAKLVLSSSSDFVVPPCPNLVADYLADDGTGEVGLMETIKKWIAKTKLGKIRRRTS